MSKLIATRYNRTGCVHFEKKKEKKRKELRHAQSTDVKSFCRTTYNKNVSTVHFCYLFCMLTFLFLSVCFFWGGGGGGVTRKMERERERERERVSE